MGAYSELDIERQYDSVPLDDPFVEGNPFEDEDAADPAPMVEPESTPAQGAGPQADSTSADQPEAETSQSAAKADDSKADEDAKRKAHEEAEARRKAEWEARQQKKKEAEAAALAKLDSMSADELMAASTQRVGKDIEKLTRRSMKECVAEHIQTMCLNDLEFAKKVMHPRKDAIHCIWYINRKAREFVEQEMKDNGFKPENGIYGSDVPDDLCYQWAVDYYNDPDAEEDKEKEDKFVPKPYPGKTGASSKKSVSKGKAKDAGGKKGGSKKADPKPEPSTEGQISLMGVA